MADYRAIVIFKAEDDVKADVLATKAAQAAGGKLDRLTKRAETWQAVASEE